MRGLTPAAVVAPVVIAHPQFEPLDGARVHVEGATASVELGQLRARAGAASRRVVTPQLSVVLINARVLVEVTAGRTTVFVEEGEVVYSNDTGTRRARAGQRIIVPEGLPIAAALGSPCEGACQARIEEAARGNGLTAQTALYELGLRANEAGQLEAARAHFREYQRRFPDGVLAPETSIALMVAERSLGDISAARAEANAFLSRFTADPRAAQVEQWRQGLR
jgi:hypothetical protein